MTHKEVIPGVISMYDEDYLNENRAWLRAVVPKVFSTDPKGSPTSL